MERAETPFTKQETRAILGSVDGVVVQSESINARQGIKTQI